MAARKVEIEFTKTYATEANAEKAAMKAFGECKADLRFFIMPTKDGRFGVVFLGQEAIQNMVHFQFTVAG